MRLVDYIVRNGRRAHPVCPSCGCRIGMQGVLWTHYGSFSGRDARGCHCPMASRCLEVRKYPGEPPVVVPSSSM